MNLRSVIHAIVAGAALWVLHSAAAQSPAAQSPIIYPSKGQSAEQQNKDTAECQRWAQANTGVDPVALAEVQAEAAPSSGPQGERVRGAARGAAAGAAIGAIAGDAGKGAAIGAGAGTVTGGVRQRHARQMAAGTTQAQQAQVSEDLVRYRKAFAACMEGRGYGIK